MGRFCDQSASSPVGAWYEKCVKAEKLVSRGLGAEGFEVVTFATAYFPPVVPLRPGAVPVKGYVLALQSNLDESTCSDRASGSCRERANLGLIDSSAYVYYQYNCPINFECVQALDKDYRPWLFCRLHAKSLALGPATMGRLSQQMWLEPLKNSITVEYSEVAALPVVDKNVRPELKPDMVTVHSLKPGDLGLGASQTNVLLFDPNRMVVRKEAPWRLVDPEGTRVRAEEFCEIMKDHEACRPFQLIEAKLTQPDAAKGGGRSGRRISWQGGEGRILIKTLIMFYMAIYLHGGPLRPQFMLFIERGNY